MGDFDFNLKGLDAALTVFRGLADDVQKEIEAEVLPDAAELLADEVRAQIPVLTGAGRASVNVKTSTEEGFVRSQVMCGDGEAYKGDVYYLSFLEFGHFQGSRKLSNRKWIAPNGFFRRSFDNKKEEIANRIFSAIAEIIEKKVAEGQPSDAAA